MLRRSCLSTWRQVMHRRPVNNGDSRVRSGLKKMHGVFSRARLVCSRVLRIRTGALASWVVLALSQFAQPTRSSARRTSCWILKVRRVSFLSRVTNARAARLFHNQDPQSRLVGQTKQSHLTWCAHHAAGHAGGRMLSLSTIRCGRRRRRSSSIA